MRLRVPLAVASLLLVAGCLGGEEPELPEAPGILEVSSPAFGSDGSIPPEFTCDGEEVSPPLSVEGVPGDAESLALLVSDPDASSGTFDHWLAWNRPPNATELPRNASGDGFQGVEGTNGFGDRGWGGPCPPEGEEHRYVFRLYAVDGTLELGPEATGDDLREALKGRALGQGALVGLYGR